MLILIKSLDGKRVNTSGVSFEMEELVRQVYYIAHQTGSWITTDGRRDGICHNDSIGKARKFVGADSKNKCRLLMLDGDESAATSEISDKNAEQNSLERENWFSVIGFPSWTDVRSEFKKA